MDYLPTISQRITLALLRPHRKLSIPELVRETGVDRKELLPVLNLMIGRGYVDVLGNRVARKTFLKSGGF
jgi:hypothetical protein